MPTGRTGPKDGRPWAQSGFTYLWALFAVLLLSLGLAAIGPAVALEQQRGQEQELVRIGTMYARAIASYYEASPGSLKQYPRQLEDLLEDRRYVGTLRHMRALYLDPMQPDVPWGLVRGADGGIRGVFSQSSRRPLRERTQELGTVWLPAAEHYTEWKFVPANLKS